MLASGRLLGSKHLLGYRSIIDPKDEAGGKLGHDGVAFISQELGATDIFDACSKDPYVDGYSGYGDHQDDEEEKVEPPCFIDEWDLFEMLDLNEF